MAPKIVNIEPYGSKIDVWALGIVVIEMFELAPSYADNNLHEIPYLVTSNGTPTVRSGHLFSPVVRKFLSCCLMVNVSHRSTAAQLSKVGDPLSIIHTTISLLVTAFFFAMGVLF
jgi:serine/threonine protein kinase